VVQVAQGVVVQSGAQPVGQVAPVGVEVAPRR